MLYVLDTKPLEEVEVKPCDWSSLFTLAGELGTKQSQVGKELGNTVSLCQTFVSNFIGNFNLYMTFW